MEQFLAGVVANGFIQTSTNNNLKYREAYDLMNKDRDERFQLDRVKEP